MADGMSRRRMLAASAAGMGLALAADAPAAPRAKVESVTVISKQPHLYHGWPTLARRRNGHLALAYSGGRQAHVCPFGRVELMTSADQGRTWTWPRVLLDSATDDRDAGVLETAKGTLLVTTFTSLAYEPVLATQLATPTWPAEKLARWKAAQARLGGAERKAELGQWLIRSTDGGTAGSPRV